MVYVIAPWLGPRSGVDDTILEHLLACALGIWATVAYTTRVGLINGLHRVRAFTAVNLGGGLLATIGVISSVQVFGRAALGTAVLFPPLASWAVAWWLTRDMHALGPGLGAALRQHAGPMLRMGATFLVGGLVTSAMQYAARQMVGNLLGPEPLGLFQATWGISGLYIGFVLSAFAADYYPRLSGLDGKPEAQAQALEAQVLLSIRLVVPVILLAILAAPLAVRLLYTADFLPMVPMLRWQLAGDVLKVTAWALSYLLLARGATWLFALVELTWAVLYLALLGVLLPRVGLVGAAYAYFICYACYLAVLLGLVRVRQGIPIRLRMASGTAVLSLVTGLVAWLSSRGDLGLASATTVALLGAGALLADAYRLGLFARLRWGKSSSNRNE